MESSTMAGLAGLALLDSLSVGTLVIPVAMLLAPGFQARRLLVYLGTLAGFYLCAGIVLLAGADAVVSAFRTVADTTALLWVQLAAGALMFGAAFFVGPGAITLGRRGQRAPEPAPARWERRLNAVTSTPGIAGVALSAGLVEIATMAPYLGAIAMLTAAPVGVPAKGAALAAYVVLMCVPALALLGLRSSAGRRAEPALERFGAWLSRQAAAAFPWILGLLGWFVGGDAAGRLFA